MKKHIFYGTLFTLSAYLCFLLACGSGEIVDLSDGSSEWKRIEEAMENLTNANSGLIADCINYNPGDPLYPGEICETTVAPSSSSEPGNTTESSSSYEPGSTTESSSSETNNNTTQSSSSAATTTSSSSVATTTSSSSVATTTSSSSVATTTSSSSVATTTSSSSTTATTPSSGSTGGDGGSGCQYDSSWCGGQSISSVLQNTAVPTTQAGNQALCYFVSTIGKANQTYSDPLVNGVNVGAKYNEDLTLPEKADGGYYVYVPAYAMFNVPTTGASIPENCQ